MMRIVVYSIISFIFFFQKTYAQTILTEGYKEDVRDVMLEFIETKKQELLTELDSIKEITGSSIPVDQNDIEVLRRMKSMAKTVPLAYNDHVKYYIEKYISTNYKPYMNRLLGLSQHYFPIYEKILSEHGLPEEIKYLSLVESSLNPHLVSTSGAVGPWQFMYITAKEYNLEMSNYHDERKDPYASSYAFARYMNDSYQQFGDWLLAIASYNCGRGCVQRAIIRSGIEKPSFWDISALLPEETRNYIPKYIAMTYVLSDAAYHDIEASPTEFNWKYTEIFVDKFIALERVAQALGLSKEEVKLYNPAYKRDQINGTIDNPKRLLLPLTNFTSDSLLYIALNTQENIEEITKEANEAIATRPYYTVKKGETLAIVAKRFGLSVQNLRAWNNLTARSAVVGKTLLLEKPINKTFASNVNKLSATNKAKKSNVIIYTVKSGDSLDRIASKYNGVSVVSLKADNNLKSNLIKPGMKLKIKQSKG